MLKERFKIAAIGSASALLNGSTPLPAIVVNVLNCALALAALVAMPFADARYARTNGGAFIVSDFASNATASRGLPLLTNDLVDRFPGYFASSAWRGHDCGR